MNLRVLRPFAFSGLMLVAACASASAGSVATSPSSAAAQEPAGPMPDSPAPWLYVANQVSATVSVIDMEADSVIATVDLQALGFTSNAKPHHVAVEPDGSYWYVSLIGDSRVLKFSRDNELVGQAEFTAPGMLVIDPGSDRLFVGRSMMAVNPPQRIGRIDRTSMTIEEVDVFFARPHALAVAYEGATVYSASLAQNSIATLDVESEDVELSQVEGPPHTLVQFAVSPDGRWLVAGGELTSRMLVFAIGDDPVPEFRIAIEVGPAPWHPMFSPDGATLWFGNRLANTVTVVDTQTWTVASVIEGDGLAEPHGIAMSPDGAKVYVSSRNLKGEYVPEGAGAGAEQNGTVVVIDAVTRQIEKVIQVGRYAAGLGAAARPQS
ncbi:MAG: beta-propeller fold lactonase family protein [Gemmatimonadota bacterium]